MQNLSGNVSYTYDELGQLVSETNGTTTYEYAYDSKGNISSRKSYSGETLVDTDTFTYGATAWKDRLTGYNNGTITYDTIGNPTSYLGADLVWRGRELSSYSKGNKQISYSYDVDGMRYQKIVKNNGTETARYDYVYSDGKLILLTYTSNGTANTARFIYDSFGEPRGFILNSSSAYLYMKNGQGDITAIVDESGEILVRYTYNAWGAVEFIVPFGIDPAVTTVLATVSPFTYRGYCYDFDLGLYYLQSRYYDPEICRFINADSTDYLGATGTLLSYNLFTYCENDWVNCVDATGTWGQDVHAGYYENVLQGKGISKYKFTRTGWQKKYIPFGYLYIYIPYSSNNMYYGTFYWAISVGINATNARIIAYWCNYVDTEYSPLFKKNQAWHFNANAKNKSEYDTVSDSRLIISVSHTILATYYLEKAKNTSNKSNRKTYINKALIELGRALHPLQDYYAHTVDKCYINLLGMWSHVTSENTDVVNARISQLVLTQRATLKLLKAIYDEYKRLLS